jgi:hypothetical protein
MGAPREILVNATELDGLLHATLVALNDGEAIQEAAGKEPPLRHFLISRIKSVRKEIATQFPKRPKSKKRYQMFLESVGNPDYGQYTPQSDACWVDGKTLTEMRAHAVAYREKWELGGGNWANPVVLEGDKEIGYFSYNGRLWTMKKTPQDPMGTEITIQEPLLGPKFPKVVQAKGK